MLRVEMMIEDVVSKVVGVAGLFQKGQAVGDPEKWKTRQISATMISGLLLAVVNLAKGSDSTFRLTQRQQTQSV